MSPPESAAGADRRVPFAEAARVWAMIGVLGFGGPAAQIALMHRELVERRKWIDEERFLHALNYCTLLPGPEAQQLATYVGWLLHRTRGGLVAGCLFVLPGFSAMLGLSLLYALFRELPLVLGLFFGLKAAVLAIVLEALLRIGKRALKSRLMVVVAACAFVSLFFFAVPFPAVVLAAGAIGIAAGRLRPALFPDPKPASAGTDDDSVVERMAAAGELAHTKPSVRRAALVVACAGTLWAAPIVAISAWLGSDSVLVREAVFFSKAAVVTFGGAYAVLAYVAEQAVNVFHWLEPAEMLDGLGLAETTPGPLILVLEFVGFMGAYRQPGVLSPMTSGLLGALVTTWVTFVPCFLWVFLGAPFIESLRSNRALRAALSSITAAVVGVILNLSLWFALHVLFRSVSELSVGPLRLLVPSLRSLEPASLLLTGAAMLAIFRFRWGLPGTLAAISALGAAYKLFT